MTTSRLVRGDLGATTTLDLAVTPNPALGDNFRVFFVQAVHVSTTEGVVKGAPRPWVVVSPR